MNEVKNLIEPAIEDLGLEIVRLKWTGGEKRKTMQIMVEPKDGGITTVEHCEAVSHTVSAILDVEDVIAEEYNLEVSSPGLDRPLTRMKDFENYKNLETKLETKMMIEGRKRFRGRVLSVEGENIIFAIDEGEEYVIPFDNIAAAKLVMNDELIEVISRRSKVSEL